MWNTFTYLEPHATSTITESKEENLMIKRVEGMFLGYSRNNKAYKVYNKKFGKVIESINVVFDDGITVEEADEDESVLLSISKSTPELDVKRKKEATSEPEVDLKDSESGLKCKVEPWKSTHWMIS